MPVTPSAGFKGTSWPCAAFRPRTVATYAMWPLCISYRTGPRTLRSQSAIELDRRLHGLGFSAAMVDPSSGCSRLIRSLHSASMATVSSCLVPSRAHLYSR
jgi:hypothetical protein